MCAQLDLEVMCKRPKKRRENHLIFINFGVKKRTPKKSKTLMFECYNVLKLPWEKELQFFEVDFQQGNFKILRLLP
jgi:hypothetical protein